MTEKDINILDELNYIILDELNYINAHNLCDYPFSIESRIADEIIKLRKKLEQSYAEINKHLDAIIERDIKIKELYNAGNDLVTLLPHYSISPCRAPKGSTLRMWCSECYSISVWKEICSEQK